MSEESRGSMHEFASYEGPNRTSVEIVHLFVSGIGNNGLTSYRPTPVVAILMLDGSTWYPTHGHFIRWAHSVLRVTMQFLLMLWLRHATRMSRSY
jgi:hypothetical protein